MRVVLHSPGKGFANAHSIVGAAGGQGSSVRAECHGDHGVCVSLQLYQGLARAQVPYDCRIVQQPGDIEVEAGASRGQAFAIGAECQRANARKMALHGKQLIATGGVPQASLPVAAAGGDTASVRAEGHLLDEIVSLSQNLKGAGRSGFPDARCLIHAASNETLSSGAESHGQNPTAVACCAANESSCGRIPQTGDPVFAAGQNQAPIGTPSDRLNGCIVR